MEIIDAASGNIATVLPLREAQEFFNVKGLQNPVWRRTR